MKAPDAARRLVAEFLGTATLLTTVVGSGIMAENLSGGNVALALLANTIPTGATLIVIIWMFGPISGAHFNPAVTLAFMIRREIESRMALLYIVVQVVAAVFGVLVAHVMFDQDVLQVSTKSRTGFSQWFAEGVATFGLVMTILGLLTYGTRIVAVGVGLFITAAYWFTASTSFANPAVTVGRSFTDTFSGIAPGDAPQFIAAQFAGAVLAVIVGGWVFKEK